MIALALDPTVQNLGGEGDGTGTGTGGIVAVMGELTIDTTPQAHEVAAEDQRAEVSAQEQAVEFTVEEQAYTVEVEE